MEFEETLALIKSQIRKQESYRVVEKIVGEWIDGEPIYREVIEITDTTLIQKDRTSKVSDLPEGFKMLIRGFGVIRTYEKSFSNNDVLIYAAKDGIYAKQTFTGYPERLYVVIEYIKEA